MPGYSRRTWINNSAPAINATNLNALEQAIYDLKYLTYNVKDYGAIGNGVADDTSAINLAIVDAAANGGTVLFPSGTYKISTLAVAGKSNVILKGAGWNSVVLLTTDTTGNVLDFTNSSFCAVEDMLIRPSTQRTAGALIQVAPGAGSSQRNRFSRLRLASGFKGIYLNGATTVMMEDIEILDTNAAWAWDSAIQLDGATRSVIMRRISGGSGATVNQALIYISGATVDTVLSQDCDLLNFSPSTGCTCLKITAGEWMRFSNFSAESGTTSDALTITGGQGITFHGVHLLGLHGATISGGKGVALIGGEVVKCQQGGIVLSGGTGVKIEDLDISDISEASSGTYDGILVTVNTSEFQIRGNVIGRHIFNTSTPKYGIEMGGGVSDRFVITDNSVPTFAVDSMAVAGTGGKQAIKNNLPEQVQTVASAATITLPGSPLVFVSGTTTITSITAGQVGREVTIKFTGILTLTDGSNLLLAGNFVTTADDTITLISDGTNWIEKSRSAN